MITHIYRAIGGTLSGLRRLRTIRVLLVIVASGWIIGVTVPGQVAQAQPKHAVGARFDAGPRDTELTLSFTVTPEVRVLPIARLLSPTLGNPRPLTVRRERSGAYSAVLIEIQRVVEGQVLIELSDADHAVSELHSADFALRERGAKGPTSSPSRDGRFVVLAPAANGSGDQRLLICSSELPVGVLPTTVSRDVVAAVYSLETIPASARADGWRLAMTVPTADARSTLFYLAKGGSGWKTVKTTPIEGHPLLTADVAGSGTYLFVRETRR